MIDIRKLKELVRLMVENDLSELDLQDQQETVTIKRGTPVVMSGAAGAQGSASTPYHVVTPAAGASAPATASTTRAATAEPEESASAPVRTSAAEDIAGLVKVTSPMVGTVYLQANPDSPPFVQVGASVGAESTVCLIEAMKVFSEIKAEAAGTIERILVSSGQAVEYGQPLFLVRPS